MIQHNHPPPRYVSCTHPNFQLRSVEGLSAIKGTALKELDLSLNKLVVLDALEQVRQTLFLPIGLSACSLPPLSAADFAAVCDA